MGSFGEAGAAEPFVTLHIELGGLGPEMGGKVIFLLFLKVTAWFSKGLC